MSAARLVAVGAVTLAAAMGCSSSDGESPKAAEDRSSVPAPASQTAEPKRAMTAAEVLQALRKSGVPLRVSVIYTAKTDPNKKLGRPGQYTSKAACVDPRVQPAKVADGKKGSVDLGCGVEVYSKAAGAQARSAYIKASIEALDGVLPDERHVLRGGVLLRVSSALTNKQAAQYKRALEQLPL